MRNFLYWVTIVALTGLFFLGLSWGLPQGCARMDSPSQALEVFGDCDAARELVGDNLRPAIGYAIGSYEKNAGEVRSAATFSVRGDKARGSIKYRDHSRFNLEAVLRSQGQEVTLADCGGAPAVAGVAAARGTDYKLEGISDRSKVDLQALMESALAQARDRWPEAVVISMNAPNVYPEGHADLTLGDGVSLVVGAPADVDESLPKGASGRRSHRCLMVSVNKDQAVARDDVAGHVCSDHHERDTLSDEVQCSAAQIWARAVKDGVSSENSVATLIYNASSNHWVLSIDDLSRRFPDDC